MISHTLYLSARCAGVAVRPGDPLFDILLNYQEIIRGQTEYLALLNQRGINMAKCTFLNGSAMKTTIAFGEKKRSCPP